MGSLQTCFINGGYFAQFKARSIDTQYNKYIIFNFTGINTQFDEVILGSQQLEDEIGDLPVRYYHCPVVDREQVLINNQGLAHKELLKNCTSNNRFFHLIKQKL